MAVRAGDGCLRAGAVSSRAAAGPGRLCDRADLDAAAGRFAVVADSQFNTPRSGYRSIYRRRPIDRTGGSKFFPFRRHTRGLGLFGLDFLLARYRVQKEYRTHNWTRADDQRVRANLR